MLRHMSGTSLAITLSVLALASSVGADAESHLSSSACTQKWSAELTSGRHYESIYRPLFTQDRSCDKISAVASCHLASQLLSAVQIVS